MLKDAIGQEHSRAGDRARIVSLVPSITELLFTLGLGEQMVGRTGFCIHPRPAVKRVPKLGGTKDVDLDGVRDARPTHVVVNVDENTRETYEQLRTIAPHVVVTHPNAPEDNIALYRLLGGIFGRETAAETLAARFEAALARLRRLAGELPARRVLYLIWRRPWMTIGRDTYVARTLALANWHTLPDAAEPRYPELTDAALRGLSPDLVLLSSEPYPFRSKHLEEVRRLVSAPGGVHLIDGEMLSWYGSRAIDGLEYLAHAAAELQETAA